MIHIGFILLALGFVFLNGFFVAAEFAMVKLRHTRVELLRETAGWRGVILSKVHQNLDIYLSACQLGITLASLGLGWVGEPAFAHAFEPLLAWVGITSSKVIAWIAFALAFSLISFLHIVAGELMPKSMAIRQAEKISLWTSIPLYSFYWIMYPAIYLLNFSANLLLKLFRLDTVNTADQAYSSDEIKLILKSSHLHGELEKTEASIIEHTLDFADLQVSDIMRPRDELIALDDSQPLEKNIEQLLSHNYSRYPVYHHNLDNVLGIVHAKDYLRIQVKGEPLSSLTEIMRPPIKIKPTCSTLKLLEQFKQGTTHLALVYRHDRLVGFLTLDNLLQIILGRINDEFHRAKEDSQVLKDGGFRLSGLISIYTLESALDLDLSDCKETTLSGLVLQVLDHIPVVNERVDFPEFYIIVEKIDGAKIKQARVYKKPSETTDEAKEN